MSKKIFNNTEAVKEKTCSGAALADALTGAELSKEEAAAWNRDLKKTRKSLKLPRYKRQ